MTTSTHYPKSIIGKRFCQFFPHRFNWIKAMATKENNKPNWFTITDYPIEHRNLWNNFISPDLLIGLSFGKTTRYTMIDIDRHSIYHPLNDELQFKKLLTTYEDIGLIQPIIVQSSSSCGIHVYFVLPTEVKTFALAVAMKSVAENQGFTVKNGVLEIFPNPKVYSKGKPSAYKAHRLPLQKESYLLDKDYQPYSNDIEVFLDLAESTALCQDMEMLNQFFTIASEDKKFGKIKGYSMKALAFANDLKEQINNGWTDFHQTNDLLRVIGTYGRIFKELDGDELVQYIIETAINSTGYNEFCRHHHDIESRSRDWGKCVEKFYYPYGSPHCRVGTFASMKEEAKENIVNFNRATESRERIVKAVEYLKEQFKQLPQKIGELKEMLLNAISQLFSIRPSDKTLYKHKDLWHPKVLNTSSQSLEFNEDTNNNQLHTDDILTIPQQEDSKLEVVLDTASDNSPSTVSDNTQTNTLEPLSTSITTNLQTEILEKNETNLDNTPNTNKHNIQQTKPLSNNNSTPCHTPPNVASEKNKVQFVESLSDNDFTKSATPPPPYEGFVELIKSWFQQQTKLVYQGIPNTGLVTALTEKRKTIKSIYSNEQVIITNCNHSSFLFSPEDIQNLVVYVTPLSEMNNWTNGIAVKAINLSPLIDT